MPIVRAENHVEVYRSRARNEPLSTLSGRYETSTEFVSSRILEALEPGPENRLLDIGCGDGTLLAMAGPVAARVGVVPTEEEAAALRAHHGPQIEFHVGRAEALPAGLADFDRVVINGVLLLLPDRAAARAALAEIARVTAPGALVWAGEIVVADEIAGSGGTSGLARLGRLLAEGRLRSLARRARRAWAATVLGREVTLVPKSLLRFEIEDFAALARGAGLEVVEVRDHFERDRSGETRVVPSRRDVLLRRAGAEPGKDIT